MPYAIIITVLAGLLLLFLLGGGFLIVRRVADAAAKGRAPFGRWRWHPSPLGLLMVLPLAGLLLFRLFPFVLLLPIVIPFFRRKAGRRVPRRDSGPQMEGETIEGEYRPLDDR